MGSGWLAAQIEMQRPHLALWIPVLFAVGIAAYFQVPAEPPGWMLAAIATFLAMGLGTLFRIGPTARILLLALMLPLAGFAVAGLRARLVAAPVLPHAMTVNVEGDVIGLDRSGSDRPRVGEKRPPGWAVGRCPALPPGNLATLTHAIAPISSRPISIRRISLVPAPISISLASRKMRETGLSFMKPVPPIACTAWWATTIASSLA